MNVLNLLADCLLYPEPGRGPNLRSSVEQLAVAAQPARREGADTEPVRRLLQEFLGRVETLDLGAWEELYTRTFDLNPPSAPYLGYQAWGDKYQRGELLTELGRRQKEAGVDPEGELADHLGPVLRYLATDPEPLPQLLGIVTPAVQKMRTGVAQLDADNPYLSVLDAVLAYTAELPAAAAGRRPTAAEKVEPGSIQLTLTCHSDIARRVP